MTKKHFQNFTVVAGWILGAAFVAPGVALGGPAEKTAIIKADDLRGSTAKWERFFALSEERGAKVSVGIICDSLAAPTNDHVEWLRSLERSGRVEFWNHGWDHKRWTDENGVQLREFSGTGHAHQARHYADAKRVMTEALGAPPAAFGAPFNAVDADMLKILAADEDLRLVFAYNKRDAAGKILAPMFLRGEHDGTGKPNFEKFREDYAKRSDLTVVALQFHPASFAEEHFVEYAKILEFMLAEGWTFALPRELVAARQAKGP